MEKYAPSNKVFHTSAEEVFFFTEENETVSAEIIKSIELEKAKAVEYPRDLWYTKGVRRETIQASLFERM